MKEILFKIRINVQQEKEIDRLKKRISELIVLRKKNNGLTAKEDVELKSLRKDYNGLTNAVIKQNQVSKTEANTLGRVNAELAIEKQRIKAVVIGSKEFDTVAARIKNLENKQRQANAAMGRGTTFVGEYARGAIQAFQKIAAGVMAAVIALRSMSRVFKGIIDTLTEFEQGQMNVQTLLEDFDEELRGESIELMRKYGLTINDTNRALFDAVSAGVAARNSFGFMNDAAVLAIAGVSDMESVVDGMTTVMNVWNLGMEDMGQVSAAFFSAQKKGKFYVSDITSEIGKSASMAKIAGMSYQELLTTYAELTKKGLPLQESTTAIKAIIKGVTAPSDQATAAFKKLDIQTGLTAVSEQGLFTILTKINQATKIEKDRLTELLPNVRAITGAAALNEEALIDWHEILKIVNEDFGEGSSIMKQYENQMGTLAKKKELLNTEWRALILSSRQGNAIGRMWGDTLVMLDTAIGKVRKGSEKLALVSDLLFKSDRLTTWMLYTAELKKQFDATHEVLTEEEKLEEQREIAASEYKKRQTALRTAEDEDEIRKAEAEEARKARHKAQQADEQQAFDDKIAKMQFLFLAQQAFDADDKEVFDAVLDEYYATQEEKKLFSDALDAENLESIVTFLDKTLALHQEEWDKEEQDLKDSENRKKAITDASFAAAGNALNAFGNLFESAKQKELSAAGDNAKKREAIERKYAKKQQIISIGQALISGAQGIIKTGAILGYPLAIPFQIVQGLQTLAEILVIKSQKFALGGKVKGIGDKDTVPAILTPGEGVINKKSMNSTDTMSLTGTPYDIASQLNSYKGFGIPFASGGVAGSTTNNTYNYNTMDKITSDISDIKVILNMNEVSEGLKEINVIQQTGEI